MMKRSIAVIMILLLLPGIVMAGRGGPKAYLTENVRADYNYTGSTIGTISPCGTNPCSYGVVEASVPNNNDVLQSVRLTLSGTTGTNLQNVIAYKNVLVSYPNPNSTSLVYVNTTDSDPDNEYIITSAPTIELSLNWTNLDGGSDLYDDQNIRTAGSVNTLNMTLNITNPSTSALNSVVVAIQFDRNTNGNNDAVNIISDPVETTGTATRVDSDIDGDYDRLEWSGNLAAQTSVFVTFNATWEDNNNYPQDTDDVNLDSQTNDKGVSANYSQTSTFTGITFTAKFARCSVRQGIDLSQSSGNVWSVRGFIENLATKSANLGAGETYLTYNVSEWRLYPINPATGEPEATPSQTGRFNQTANSPYITPDDGRVYTTDSSRSSNTSWYNTGSSTKPYYASYFDWEVVWDQDDPEFYYGIINTTMNLPTLHKIDIANVLNSQGDISPNTGGENVTITATSTHVGSVNAPGKYVRIYSVIPANTTAGVFHGWFDLDPNSVKVYFNNGTDYEISSSSYTQNDADPASDGSDDGFVEIIIDDVSGAILTTGDSIGHYLMPNEYIKVEYTIVSNESMSTGDVYNFTGNGTQATPSGTYLKEYFTPTTVSVAGKRLTGYKDLAIYNPSTPTLVNSSIVVSVEGGTINGIKFLDYVPQGTDFDTSNVSVWFYDGSSWTLWAEGVDYNITDNGTVTLSDGKTAHAYEYINASGGGWNLDGGQMINATYQMNITQEGVYVLPAQIAGFDPVTGMPLGTTVYGVIKIDIPESLVPLQIREDELSLGKRVLVGEPALWVKRFEVFNPNSRPAYGRFETEVFPDTMSGYVTYYDLSGKSHEISIDFDETGGKRVAFWEDKIEPLETRSYELRILTPPVLEIDRDVEVLEKLENKKVKLKMDIYLKNFAEEPYENVILNLPINYENMISVRDAFGDRMRFTGGRESTSVVVDEIEGGGIKTVSVIYKQSYPTVIITPERDRFNLNSPVGLSILVINGGDEIKYPYLETEVYTPGMEVIFTNIRNLESMEPLEKTELAERFFIPTTAPTGNYIAVARFRKNFATLATGTGRFMVSGPGSPELKIIEVLILLAAIFGLGYLSYRRIKEVRSTIRIMG